MTLTKIRESIENIVSTTFHFEILAIKRAIEEADIDVIEAVYRTKAKKMHPDAGGSTEDFQELQTAIEEARSANR